MSVAPTTVAPTSLTRVALQVGPHRYDIALDPGRTVADVVRAAGVAAVPGLLVLDSGGRALDPGRPVATQVPDGSVVHLVAPAPRPRGRAARALERAQVATRRPDPQPALLAVAAVCALVVATTEILDPAHGGTRALVLALGSGVLALLLAVSRPAAADAATLTAPALALAAGVAWVDPAGGVGSVDGRLALVVALVTAAAVSAVRYLTTRAARTGDDLAAVVLVGLLVVAGVAVAVLLAGLPGTVAAAVLLGLVPLALRTLPALTLGVPDDQLIDLAHVSRTAPTVRGPRPRGLGRVNERQVDRSVHRAERRSDAGVLLVCLLPPLLVPPVLTGATTGTVPGWGALVLLAGLLAVLALQPRAARGAVARWAPRVAAAIVLVEVALLGGDRLGEPVVLACAAVLLAVGCAGLALPLHRGWRSVGASRLADLVEALGVVLTLPAALVAVDLIETLRRMTS
ncbi:MAG TPA: hypothetical protein VGC57_00355 [Cellulomonas sp.]